MTPTGSSTLTHSAGYVISREGGAYVARAIEEETADLELVAKSLEALVEAIDMIATDASRELPAKPGWLRAYYEWESGRGPGRIEIAEKLLPEEVTKVLNFEPGRRAARRQTLDRLAAAALPLAAGWLIAADMADGILDFGGILAAAINGLI